MRINSNEIRRANKSSRQVDLVRVPEEGVSGNSYMMMVGNNSSDIATQIQEWLKEKGLTSS